MSLAVFDPSFAVCVRAEEVFVVSVDTVFVIEDIKRQGMPEKMPHLPVEVHPLKIKPQNS